MAVQVITESDTGLGGELGQRLGIRVLAHYINYRGQSYSDLAISRDKFLTWLESGEEITTAHPTIHDLIAAFSDAGKSNDQILYITISSQYSKTYALAMSLRKRLPELRIEVLDSKRAAGGHAMMAIAAARLASSGQGVEEIVSALTNLDERIDEILVVDSLRQLAREGRTRNAEKVLSSIITVKPLVSHRGGLATPIGKARTNTQALDEITSRIKKALARFDADTISFLVEYGLNEPWADEVAARLMAEFSPRMVEKIPAAPSTLLRIGARGWTVAWMVDG